MKKNVISFYAIFMRAVSFSLFLLTICFCNSLDAQLTTFYSSKNNRFGFLNRNGDTLLLPVFYSYAKAGVSNFFVRAEGQNFHPISDQGKIDSSRCYVSVTGLPNGKTILNKCDSFYYSICDSTGKTIFPVKFNYVSSTSNFFIGDVLQSSQLPTGFRDKYTFDKELNFLFKTSAKQIREMAAPDNEFIFLAEDSAGFCFYNKNGIPLSAEKFREIKYRQGMPWYIARKEDKFGVMNFRGETLIPFIYTNLSQSDDSLFNISQKIFLTHINDTTSVLVDISNNIHKTILYNVSDYAKSGMIVEKEIPAKRGKETETRFGVLSWDGQLLTPFAYDNIYFVEETDLFMAGNGDLYDLYDRFGNKQCAEKLAGVSTDGYELKNELILEDKNYLKFIYNLRDQKTGNVKFENSEGQYIAGEPDPFIYKYDINGKYGLMNEGGDRIIDAQYDDFTFLSKTVFYAEKYSKKNYKFYLYDLSRFSAPVMDFDEIISDDEKGNLVVMKKIKNKKEFSRIQKDGKVFPLEGS